MSLIEPTEKTVCKELVLDSSYPGISFNENGICQFYDDFHANVVPHWHPNDVGRKKLEAIVEQIRRDGEGKEFDCIMGLSGGADSSYMLHVLVTEFNLRPLVFHVDGGWNSEVAVNNINNLVDGLDVDLYTEVINWREMQDFQLAMFKSGVPHLDIPQDMAFIGVLYKFARQHNIKYIFNGGNIATESVPRPLDLIYWTTDMSQIKDILRQFGSVDMDTFPFTSVLYHKFYLRYFHGIKVVKPLNFIPYVKADAMELLEDKYGWKKYPQKHFESRFTRFFEGFWLQRRFGFDMRQVDLSSLILSQQITRTEALDRLRRPPYDESLISRDFEYVANKLGISVDQLTSYLEMPKKFFWDYRNQKRMFSVGEMVLSKLASARRGGAF